MKTMLLSDWRITGQEPQADGAQAPCFPDVDGGDWLPCRVPGDVNATLVEHGRMPNPHYDTQARQCYWVTAKDWWYCRQFDAPPDSRGRAAVELCFDSADGPADVFLNRECVGQMQNAFRLHRFNIAGKLKESGNELLIRFKSIDQLLGGPRLDEHAGWKNRRAWLRKPQFNFGWDWALPLPSIGLAGPVWLESGHEQRFLDLSLQPFVSGRVDFFFEASPAARKAGHAIRLEVSGHGTDISRTMIRANGQVIKPPNCDRKRLTIKRSADDGKSWPIAKVIEEGPSGYSALARLTDGTFLCLYEADIVSGMFDDRYLRLARFDLTWLATPTRKDNR